MPTEETKEDPKLKDLATKIKKLGDEIRDIKNSKDEDVATKVKPLVDELINAKTQYAALNNGIGIDGKPIKQEKKEKGKEKQEKDPNSKSAQKKAAKKAAKKEAKKGHQEAPSDFSSGAAAVKKTQGKSDTTSAKGKKAAPTPTPTATRVNSKLAAMELLYNPNTPFSKRPILALTTAILLKKITLLKISSDHKFTGTTPQFGIPTSAKLLSGDVAISFYLCKYFGQTKLIGSNIEEECIIQQWLDYANQATSAAAIEQTLDYTLRYQTYVCLKRQTLVDFILWNLLLPDTINSPNVKRWYKTISKHPSLCEATQMLKQNSNEISEKDLSLPSGMSLLEGGIQGHTVTRFPPEPSGYLHIGHAKACLLNNSYAKAYRGRLIVRMDDTNPSKEKAEFHDAILHDLSLLNVVPDVITYTSDYIGVCHEYAVKLINQGLAFMDDTPQDIMQNERMNRTDSKYRNTQTPEEALKLFKEMCKGTEEGGKWCCRVKMNMQSDNGTMRDPVIYRQNLIPHPRTGTKYFAYPTYDFACPIVDSIEGVTHALRTTEYNDRDEQYIFFQTTLLKLNHVTRIHSFARMNFQFTELSKRKLTWFVENKLVTGWDDARFPTIRGVIRRGIHIPALTRFICSQGASRRVTNMEWGKFWAENKKELDVFAKRFMAVDANEHVECVIEGGSKEEESFVSTNYLPKDESAGKRVVSIGTKVLLEKVDTDGMVLNEELVLMRYGVFCITNLSPLTLKYVPNGNVKTAKRKLSWMTAPSESNYYKAIKVILTEFDNLLTKEKLEEGDDFKDYVNPNTMAETVVLGDAGMKLLQQGEIIQLERRGFFRVDKVYICEDKPLVLFMIPDGKKSSMSGLVGKLAHH